MVVLLMAKCSMTAPLVYRVPELAELLQISRASVYKGIMEGRIPVVRNGRSVRVPRWWVDEQIGGRAA